MHRSLHAKDRGLPQIMQPSPPSPATFLYCAKRFLPCQVCVTGKSTEEGGSPWLALIASNGAYPNTAKHNFNDVQLSESTAMWSSMQSVGKSSWRPSNEWRLLTHPNSEMY
jgi:hypothetical protein